MPTEQEKRWIEAWKKAGPELERIRNEELKNLSDTAGLKLLGAFRSGPSTLSGLITLQSWLMRFRVLENLKAGKSSA